MFAKKLYTLFVILKLKYKDASVSMTTGFKSNIIVSTLRDLSYTHSKSLGALGTHTFFVTINHCSIVAPNGIGACGSN